jgi:hypothetical protein
VLVFGLLRSRENSTQFAEFTSGCMPLPRACIRFPNSQWAPNRSYEPRVPQSYSRTTRKGSVSAPCRNWSASAVAARQVVLGDRITPAGPVSTSKISETEEDVPEGRMRRNSCRVGMQMRARSAPRNSALAPGSTLDTPCFSSHTTGAT